ncbi:hypothetical protein SAMN06298216_1872 [Spirosomataceae bacterium TFI 002]|nr:hypothetical protein SAMN06298216_1872 [Spirosomataceae bacterium TFI 002]
MDLANIKLNILAKKEEKGTKAAIADLLGTFAISHPNFKKIVYREASEDKTVVITTEGNYGESEKQLIRVPKNLLDFPIDFIAHMLAHEFVHIEQRARPGYNASREEREFEAYYHGVFPTKYNLPPCPDWLRLQFCKSIDRYYNNMGYELKKQYEPQYNEVMKVKRELEEARLK